MRVLHSSDLHGRYEELFEHGDDFDVWLDTGDFFPDGADPGNSRWQKQWFTQRELGRQIREWLAGRPAIVCGGNHDFADLYRLLLDCPPAKRGPLHCIAHGRPPVEVGGLTWAGFREIPWIEPFHGSAPMIKWVGETRDMSSHAEAAVRKNPDVLVTHCPPAGILDCSLESGENEVPVFGRRGCGPLAAKLMYEEHTIRWHFFGHVHYENRRAGGRREASVVKIKNTTYVNGATLATVHEISPNSSVGQST